MLMKTMRSITLIVLALGIAAMTVATLAPNTANAAIPEASDAGRTPTSAAQQSEESPTVVEVEQAVIEYFRYMRENSKSRPESYSGLGSLEFWSSGGLVMEVPPEGLAEDFELFNLHPKHIQVLELAPEKAAVALFYAEGSLHPKGGAFVGRYLTRVTQVFVKEDGQWRIRSSHWSPLTGGAGTNQVSVEQ